jgi:hypothetical protein
MSGPNAAALDPIIRRYQNVSRSVPTSVASSAISPMKDAPSIAAELSTPERLLLFCLASGTEWKRAGVTQSTVTRMIVVRGLVQRDPLGRLSLTKQGRAELDTLLQPRG